MVYELERVLRVCNGFLCSMSVTSLHHDIIKRALSSAGFNAVLEPVGLDRGDGKHPDGITVFPFSRRKCLIWDSTCVNSFSPQHWL